MTDKPDLFTTAGKIADLRARYTEAVVDAEAKAKAAAATATTEEEGAQE